MKHIVSSSNLIAKVGRPWFYRSLIKQMVWREIVGRYRGSVLGLIWTFVNPLFLLAVYTFVFSTVLQSRWSVGDQAETSANFAAVLFVGLIVHGLLGEVLGQAPTLIAANVSYVKKVIFPLVILPAISMGAALFHAFISVIVLLLVQVLVTSEPPYVTALLLPLVFLPFVLLLLGLSWIFAAAGVFIRDIGQVLSPMILAALFISPVFFPITALPEAVQPFLMLNPITLIVEQSREVLIYGHLPDFYALAIYGVISCTIAGLGLSWFQKTRKGFADVL